MALQTKQFVTDTNLIPSALVTVHIHYGFMSCYLEPNNCLLPQLFSLCSQLLTLTDKLGHLGIQNILKKYSKLPPLTSTQSRVCLATLRLLPRGHIPRLCSHRPCCPGLISSQVLLPSSDQLFPVAQAGHTCMAPMPSTRGPRCLSAC